MRNQTLRGLTALIVVFSLILPSTAWSVELAPPQWTDCTVNGEQFACMTPAQLKHVMQIYLEAKKSASVVLLLETQLKLSSDINDSLTTGLEKLVVQGTANSVLLKELKEELIRQDVGTTDVWDTVLYIVGATLVGFTGGVLTTLWLGGRE
jgi:hypothetical protein